MPNERYPELLSLAAHELRTPASVVGGYLRMLQRDADLALNDRQRHMFSEAEKSCARLVAIVAELSDIGKLDAGAAAVESRRFDAFETLADVAAHVHEARDREVILEVRGEAAGAPMVGDAARMKAAFDAILRAMLRERAGPCTVVADRRRATRQGAASAVVVVADERSVQGAYDAPPAPFDELRGGLGLALPIARRVIEQHGGRLWAPAGDAARGAAVIVLPVSE